MGWQGKFRYYKGLKYFKKLHPYIQTFQFVSAWAWRNNKVIWIIFKHKVTLVEIQLPFERSTGQLLGLNGCYGNQIRDLAFKINENCKMYDKPGYMHYIDEDFASL